MFYVEMGAEKANIKEDHPKIPLKHQMCFVRRSRTVI